METRGFEYEAEHKGIEDCSYSMPPPKKNIGGWKWTLLLLANQGLATLAFFGVGVNLVLFLTRVLGQGNADAANSVSMWTGTVYLCSLLGAFLSDSYLGRYLTCTIFQLILVFGLVLLSVSSRVFLIKPDGCGDGKLSCSPPSSPGILIFYLSIYLVALGYGSHQPTLATFGADQFDDTTPKGMNSKAAFFCYFYFALNAGSLFSNTILVYYEDTGMWTLGFLVATGSAVLALVLFLLGTQRYRYVKPLGNPLPRVAQVFVSAARKWDVVPAKDGELYELEGSESTIKGSRKILHSDKLLWWKETHNRTLQGSGILYTATSRNDFMQILLHLRREDSHMSNKAEESFSGCELALVSETMWLQTLKRCFESGAVNSSGEFAVSENQMHDVFPLKIRLSASEELLKAKLTQIDNTMEVYKKASNIFCTESEPLKIWDFSGQTHSLFVSEGTASAADYSERQSHEIFLELQVHGLSDLVKGRCPLDQCTTLNHSIYGDTFWTGPVRMNGGTHRLIPNYHMSNSGNSQLHYGVVDFLAMKGLKNLGNTCFMNSALQCLVHTPKLAEFFLGDYRKEINIENPLGMKGEIALAFGDLLRKIWSPGRGPVYPGRFKSKLEKFAFQFSGYHQHDAQEFLAFLLDGLHEDLNRVKQKPYIEIKDAENCIDEEVAEEYWHTHLARNNSIIVDACQGQFRSRLVCPVCKKMSITFDPFMYLTLPLPSVTTRSMTITIVSTDGTRLPSPLAVSVPKSGSLNDLILALKNECSISDNDVLLLAEVFDHRVLRYLEDPDDSLDLIRDDDLIVAYRLPKVCEYSFLVDFVHQKAERNHFGRLSPQYFGIPLVAKLPDRSSRHDIRELFLQLVKPFLKCTSDMSNECDDAMNSSVTFEDLEMEDAVQSCETELDFALDEDKHFVDGLEFYLNGSIKVKMDEPIISKCHKSLRIYAFWPEMLVEKYDNGLVSSLPEVFKPQFFTKMPQESVSLYKCLEAFLKEEPLGPEDMWYCPQCKDHQQASKKLDLWRLPEVLVVHLKRFSYNRWQKNKLETFVDFPIDDFDLSSYIANRRSHFSCRYVLYAISNHYGGLGGGHYTAFVRLAGDQWYEFDDATVSPMNIKGVKTSSAYVLFYRRVV